MLMLIFTHKIHGVLSMHIHFPPQNTREVAGCWLAAGSLLAGCWLAGCWLAGCWLAGCWLAGNRLAAGWLLAAGRLAASRLHPASQARPSLGLPSGGFLTKNVDFTKENDDFLIKGKNHLQDNPAQASLVTSISYPLGSEMVSFPS